jgi:hypothetical protein
MNPLIPSVGPNTPVLLEKTRALAQEKKIDSLENLKNDSLYIFSGKSDHVVATSVVEQTVRFFEEVGVPKTAIVFDTAVDAGHALITQDNVDVSCSLTKAPFINNCGFEQSWRILNHIFKTLKAPVAVENSSLVAFDQTEFIDSANTSMSDVAYAYIPESCRQEKGCAVHVAFHGCLQGADVIQDKYYAKTGYNEIAQANRMIILYPQVKPSYGKPLNPQGCWDFWGYSSPDDANPDYYTKQAPQLRAVYKMVQRLAGN